MSLLTINLITGHSVMRTCAHVSISDCKTANGVQYCYCAFQDCYQACNSLDRHLAPVVQGGEGSSSRLGKEVRGGKEHKEEVDKVERKALGFTSAAHSPPAFASQYPAGHFTDDEVNIFSASITINSHAFTFSLSVSFFLTFFHNCCCRTWKRGPRTGATSTTTSTTTARRWTACSTTPRTATPCTRTSPAPLPISTWAMGGRETRRWTRGPSTTSGRSRMPPTSTTSRSSRRRRGLTRGAEAGV